MTPLEKLLYQTYTIALPIVLTALMGYIVWLLKEQKKDRDANTEGTKMLLMIKLIEYLSLIHIYVSTIYCYCRSYRSSSRRTYILL